MPEDTDNPVFEVENPPKSDGDMNEAQIKLAELQVAHASIALKMRELESIVRSQRDGVVEATVVDAADGEEDGLLVYASNAARRVFAQKVTTPACFHQVTTVKLLDPDASMADKMLFVATSVALLLLQTITLISVAGGVSAPSCVHNSDCQFGNYCSELGYCTTCLMADGLTPRFAGAVLSGDGPGSPFASVDATALNATRFCSDLDPNSAEGNFCQACYDPDIKGDHWNIGRTMPDRLTDATRRMRGGDWGALLLVAGVVGLYCAGELRDIKLCQITFEQRNGAGAPLWVRGLLFMLIAVRQYTFLPYLVHIVAMLVMHRGSDAISICFNAVAVLFLLDIDVALFQFWIPEKVRQEMEEFGAPTIREVDATFLAAVKRSHALLDTFWIFMAIWIAGSTGNAMAQGLTNVAFLMTGIYEAFVRARLFDEETIGRALLNFLGSFFLGTM